MSYKRLKSIKESVEEEETGDNLSPKHETSQNTSVSKDEDKVTEKKDKSYVKSVLNKFEDHCLLLTSQNSDAFKYPRGLRQSQSLPNSPLKGDHEFFDEKSDEMLLVEHEETEYGPGLSR